MKRKAVFVTGKPLKEDNHIKYHKATERDLSIMRGIAEKEGYTEEEIIEYRQYVNICKLLQSKIK